MQHLKSLIAGAGAYIPLRLLLFAGGAAATTAGIRYYVKKRGEAERKSERARASLTQDPDQISGDVDEFRIRQTVLAEENFAGLNQEDRTKKLEELLFEAYRECERKTKVSLAEAEKKHKTLMESKSQLEKENSNLASQVNRLQDLVQQLEEEISEKCDGAIGTDLQSACETCSTLRSQYEETLKQHDELHKECERERKAYGVLKSQYYQMKENLLANEKSLMVSLTEAMAKHEQAMESNAQIQKENSDYVRKLSGKMQQMMEKFHRIQIMYDGLKQEFEQEKKAYRVLKAEYDRMKESLSDNEKSLMVSLGETVKAYEQAMESNAKLEKEKSDLKYHVHKLNGTVLQLERTFYECDITCGVIKQERESAREAYSTLKSQHEETLKQHNELMVSLAEAEKKRKTLTESNSQLENENSNLASQVNVLQNLVRQLEEEISEKCGGMIMTEDQQAQGIPKTQYNEMKECLQQCNKLLNKHRTALGFVQETPDNCRRL